MYCAYCNRNITAPTSEAMARACNRGTRCAYYRPSAPPTMPDLSDTALAGFFSDNSRGSAPEGFSGHGGGSGGAGASSSWDSGSSDSGSSSDSGGSVGAD